MRVLFFGSSSFAEPSLCRLVAMPDVTVVGVVTKCDRPQGRGRKSGCTPIRTCATGLDLPILQPQSVRAPEFIEQAVALAPDVIVLASFGQIIPRAVLDLAPMGPVNVHPSLLPAFRGAAPVQRAIMAGLRRTGICTMMMVPRLDAGDVLLRREVEIGPDETSEELLGRLAVEGADLLVETLARIRSGDCPRSPQEDASATYAPPIVPSDCAIDWTMPATQIHNQVRGLAPTPGARTEVSGLGLKVLGSRLGGPEGQPGTVTAIGREGVHIGTGAGGLLLTEVQPQSSRRMRADEWARGSRLQVGTTLARTAP